MNHNKRLGQHFLRCGKCLTNWERAIRRAEFGRIVEIGGGDGAITELISRNLVVLEIDGRFTEALSKKFPGKVIKADCARLPLKRCGKETLIVSNLPYNAAVNIILEAIAQTESDMLIGVQEEFAEKIIAKPGSEMYSAIGVIAQNFFECKKLFRMEGRCFEPAAHVASAVVSLVRKQLQPPKNLPSIYNTLSKILSQRNKNLSWLKNKYGIHHLPGLSTTKIGALSPDELLKAAAMILFLNEG